MRVTHIITRLIVGGAQENTVDSVLGLRARHGLEVDLISGPTTGAEGSLESAFAGIPSALTIAPHLVRPVRPWHDVQALRELRALLEARRPQLVHTHSGKAGVLGRLAAQRAGVPIIVHTIHGPSFGRFQGPAANCAFRLAEKIAARHTTHFISVAHAMTRQYLQAGIGHAAQFTRILSGFNLQPFQQARSSPETRRRLGLAPDDFVVAKMARLAPLKGHEELISIAPSLVQSCPRLKFLLLGDGPSRAALERSLRQRGLREHFVFTGLVPPPEVPSVLAQADILVHLSRREGLARALTQAQAAAKPIVAYDGDGAPEACRHEQTGFLVKEGDHATLATRILQLAADPELVRRLGACGQALVVQEFGVERMVDEIHALYTQLFRKAAQTNLRSVAPKAD
jgi:glycosyltransferase involved in cell wall biosynthesis